MLRSTLALGAALALSACGTGDAPDTSASFKEASGIKEADFERYANAATKGEYPLYLSLLKASGLEQELGGTEPARAALHELMGQWKRSVLGATADLPKLIKAQDGDPSTWGMSGLAASSMLGMTLGLYADTLEPGKSLSRDDSSGKLTVKTSEKGIESYSEARGEIAAGLTGTVATKVNYDICPAADGKVNVEFESMTKLVGKSGAGTNLHVVAKLAMTYDDEAQLTDQMEGDVQVKHETFTSAGQTAFVDATLGSDGQSTVNAQTSGASPADLSAVTAQQKMAQMIAMSILIQSKKAVEAGRCVELKAQVTPAGTHGVKPKSPFTILAQPRSKVDGAPAGGSVVATLSGEGALDPAGTKVPADATFNYVAPAEEQKRGAVNLEARSRRGVGKAMVDFDTMQQAWVADGGADAYHGHSTVCDFSKPFTISGSGVTNSFTPTSPTTGTYTYKGNMGGVVVWGSGTYTVTLNPDGSGGKMVASGSGSVRTPLGIASANGAERYTLTPAPPC